MVLSYTTYEAIVNAIRAYFLKKCEGETSELLRGFWEDAYAKFGMEHWKFLKELPDAKKTLNDEDYGVYCLRYGTIVITIVLQFNFDGTVSSIQIDSMIV